MADNKKLSEKGLMKDLARLFDKHGLPAGKTTIDVKAVTASAEEAVQCVPPKVPTLITITLADGTKVTTTICK